MRAPSFGLSTRADRQVLNVARMLFNGSLITQSLFLFHKVLERSGVCERE
jgi:hypothetical protein